LREVWGNKTCALARLSRVGADVWNRAPLSLIAEGAALWSRGVLLLQLHGDIALVKDGRVSTRASTC
jgi:hypothetical protein